MLSLEYSSANLVLYHPGHAKGGELSSVRDPHKRIHLGLHPDHKQAFPGRADVHQVQGNAEPPPRELGFPELAAEHLRRDQESLVRIHPLRSDTGEAGFRLLGMIH